MIRRPPSSPLFPSPPPSRSALRPTRRQFRRGTAGERGERRGDAEQQERDDHQGGAPAERSEEHTSELQSQSNLVCRLLLEKKKIEHKSACSSQSLPHL